MFPSWLRRKINHESVTVIKASGAQERLQRNLKGEAAGLGLAEGEAQGEEQGKEQGEGEEAKR